MRIVIVFAHYSAMEFENENADFLKKISREIYKCNDIRMNSGAISSFYYYSW